MKVNTMADKLCGTSLIQLTNSYQFKLPRINEIRRYRDLYNNKRQRQLRLRYNVPIPIFAGMIDTLQADLDDGILLKAEETDPRDFLGVKKFNAALEREQNSARPDASWNEKFRSARQECLMTGRGTLKYIASNEGGGFHSELDDVAYEDFFFEPKGGRQLEKHLFCGQINIWKTKKQLEDEAGGLYDAGQIRKLLVIDKGNEYKQAPIWENYDFANRFLSMNLSPESNNYVGEPMYHFVEWGLTYEGKRWYLLFEAYTQTWVRFEKLKDINSSGFWPWMSFASHGDKKNFATKGFADDLYPAAIAMGDLFNEDLENKRRLNSNARAYDKDMFDNVAELDMAQLGRDRLVRADTKGGTRRIDQGIYRFDVPELRGTIDTMKYMEDLVGRNYGVTDLQQGDAGGDQKRVGVVFQEMSAVSKRLSFQSAPIISVGEQLGMRVFSGLKDYMKEPLSIKILGEDGYNWDLLHRIDLNIEHDFEIKVTSQSKENKMNVLQKQKKLEALEAVANRQPLNPNVNYRVIDEHELREGGWSEAEIALMLDPNTQADKTTIAQTSAAIQQMMLGKMPPINYNATAYFLQKILDFVKTHQADPKVKSNYKKFLDYIQKHEQIAMDNEKRRAQKQAAIQKAAMASGSMPPANGGEPGAGATPGGVPVGSPTGSPAGSPVGAPQLTPSNVR